jgi:hypothetical protein
MHNTDTTCILEKLTASGMDAMFHLASNVSLFRYDARDHERLVMEAKKIMALSEDRQAEEKRDIAKKDSRFGQILIEQDSWLLIKWTLEFEQHFDDVNILTTKWLRENMVNVYGGVCILLLNLISF